MSDPSPFDGKRVYLRAFEPADSGPLREVLNHPALAGRRYGSQGTPGDLPLSARQVEETLGEWAGEKSGATLAVIRREGDALVGHTQMQWDWDALCPFAAVVIAPAHQRQGLGTETLDIILRYLFENTMAHVVTAWIDDWNEAGRSFAAKAGFIEAGAMRRAGFREGRWVDAVVFDLLRSEWRARAGR